MDGRADTADPVQDAHALLPLALSRPQEALAQARARLGDAPPPLVASIARQAIGIVLRDHGDVAEAVRELRTALRLARASRSLPREADVRATLGLTLVYAGRSAAGLAALDVAAAQADGVAAGQILVRRGLALWLIGRHPAARADLNRAVALLRGARDVVWEARALTARAFTHLALGATGHAASDLARAEELLAASDQWYGSAVATHNRGLVAFRAGDLPTALGCLDRAHERYLALGVAVPDLAIDRCAVLLAAGLGRDAIAEADAGIVWTSGRAQATKRAELVLTAAGCALAAGDAELARVRAAEARRLFTRQRRAWWKAHARLLELRASAAAGAPPGRLLAAARRCADELAELASPEADLAQLLVGEAALAAGRRDEALRALGKAAAGRRRGPPLTRAVGWLAEARRAAVAGDSRSLLHACRSGLAVIDGHRNTLGSSELRAQASAHGLELAVLAQRHALQRGRPRDLLVWSERWRACAMAVPPVRPPDDPGLSADLAALREVGARLGQAGDGGAASPELHREQRRLERAVRARALRVPGGVGHGPAGLDVDALLAELGATRLLQIVDIDGALHVLVCGDGRVQRFSAGSARAAAQEVDLARAGLNRVARSSTPGRAAAALQVLTAAAPRLAEVLLGEARQHLGDGPVVVVPPGSLHAVPWALLPELTERVVSVAPSAASWLRARRGARPPTGRLVLVRGPGLAAAGSEVTELARMDPSAVVLCDGTATAARTLAALDGADVAHIAAHGTFRADSPLFSALRLDDGPLTVYDLERLGRAPRRVVLASCDSGLLAPAGADELLGLAGSLLPMGTTGIVASVVRVDDAAAAALMVVLHAHLRRGASLAEALTLARRETEPGPVSTATGWSFVCLGAD